MKLLPYIIIFAFLPIFTDCDNDLPQTAKPIPKMVETNSQNSDYSHLGSSLTSDSAVDIPGSVNRRLFVFDHKLTISIVEGTILSTKAFLFVNNDAEVGHTKPKYEIFTKVNMQVTRSYKTNLVGEVVFWYPGGVLDSVDWIDYAPVSSSYGDDMPLSEGDTVIAAIQDGKFLPNGESVLRSRGYSLGILFLDTTDEHDALINSILVSHFNSTYPVYE